MKLRKTLLSLALLGAFSAGAQANMLTFVEPDTDVIEFDRFDFSAGDATATQTDSDSSGDITGPDTFFEFGGFSTITMDLGGSPNPLSGVGLGGGEYEIHVLYSLAGVASATPNPAVSGPFAGTFDIEVAFDTGTAIFYLEEPVSVDSTFAGAADATVTQLFTTSLVTNGGGCGLNVKIVGGLVEKAVFAACAADFSVDVGSTAAGYLFANGNDWAGLSSITLNASLDVESFAGLYFDYSDQETAVGDGDPDEQVFTITHDATSTFTIPEPASIAMMGLGLLGLGGFARRRK